MTPGGLDEHARLGFAALTPIRVVVRADHDVIEWQGRPKLLVLKIDRPGMHRLSGDVGLVRDDDEQEPGLVQRDARLAHARQQFELLWCRRWVRHTVNHERAAEHAVAIQEHCASHDRALAREPAGAGFGKQRFDRGA